MLSYIARRSLVLTSRGCHMARAMSMAVNVKSRPQILDYGSLRLAEPVSTSWFRFSSGIIA